MKLSRPAIILSILVLFQYSKSFSYDEFDSLYNLAKKGGSIALAGQAVQIATQLQDPALMAKSYFLKGYQEDEKLMYYQALNSYFEALKYYRISQSPTRQAITLMNLGIIYRKAGFYERALIILDEALGVTVENADQETASLLRYQVARVHRFSGNYREAISNYHLAVEMFKQQQNQYLIKDIYAELGVIAEQQGDFTAAAEYYNLTMDNSSSPTEIRLYDVLRQYNNLGYMMLKESHLDSAKILFTKGIEIGLEQEGDDFLMSVLCGNLAKVYEIHDLQDSSIFWYEKSVAYLKHHDNCNKDLLPTLKLLADHFENRDQRKSRHYQNEIYEFANRLTTLQEQLRQAHIRYQVEAANYKRESQLRYQAQLQQKTASAWIFSTVIIITLLVVLYFRLKEAKRKRRALSLLKSLKGI